MRSAAEDECIEAILMRNTFWECNVIWIFACFDYLTSSNEALLNRNQLMTIVGEGFCLLPI